MRKNGSQRRTRPSSLQPRRQENLLPPRLRTKSRIHLPMEGGSSLGLQVCKANNRRLATVQSPKTLGSLAVNLHSPQRRGHLVPRLWAQNRASRRPDMYTLQRPRHSSPSRTNQDGIYPPRTTLQTVGTLHSEGRRIIRLRDLQRLHTSHNHITKQGRIRARAGNGDDAGIQTQGRLEKRTASLGHRSKHS